jgi:tetratricopeptide (TPR) repeat protein
MLEALLGNSVSRKFVKSIHQATEGNPYFVEELIKSLAVDGQIRLQDGRWAQQHTSLVPVPGSIKAVLGKRVEYIKRQSRELLQLAATIGRNFALSLLEEASPYGDDVNQKGVEEALGAQLIEVVDIVDRPTGSSSTEIDIRYRFQHALIRETLYEELRPLRRRQLHRRVASAMEKLAGGEPIGNPGELAHHFVAGAEDDKAVPYLRQAGESAYRFYGNEEAVEHFSQACEILEDIAVDLAYDERQANRLERFELLTQQRNIFDLMSDRGRELNTLRVLLELAETMSDRDRWVQVMSRLSTYYWHVGKLDEAERTARKALRVAQENDIKRGEQYALERIARVLWTRRDSKSMEYAVRSLELARQFDDRAREGRLIELIGHIYASTLRDVERAATNFNLALDICRETKNPYEEAWTLWGIGGLNMLVGDYTAALARYAEAKKISEDIGAMLQVGWDLYRMGDVWYNLGDHQQALALYQQAFEIFDTANHPRGTIYALISLGLVHTALGNLEEATPLLEQARQQSEQRDDLRLMFRSYEALADYYRRGGGEENLTNVVRLSNRIIKMATQVQDFENEILGYHLRAVGFFELKRPQEAIESSNGAVTLLERFNYIESPQFSAAEIYYLHSRIASAMGQLDSARAYLERAYTDIVRRTDLIADEQLRQAYLEVPLNREIVAAGQRL